MCSDAEFKLGKYTESFKNLNTVFYKTFTVDGLSVKILGINYMGYWVDWYVPRHKHSFFEFHYVCEGDCYTELLGSEYRILPHQFYIIPPGTTHSHRQTPGTGHIGFALKWKFDGSEQGNIETKKIEDSLNNASSVPIDDNFGIYKMFVSLLEEASSIDSIDELSLQLSFFKLLIKLSNVFSGHKIKSSSGLNYNLINNNTAVDTLNFLEENYSTHLRAEDVANAVHISYSHLSRLFKQSTGVTIMEKLTHIRLEKAKELLLFTDCKLNDIAMQTGFTSEYYFISCFKSLYGISPGKFRTQNRCATMF